MEPAPPTEPQGAAAAGGRRTPEPDQDDAAAHAARHRYRSQGITAMEPDERISPLLAADEQLLAVRRAAGLDRRQPAGTQCGGLRGDLYVTSVRIVHVGTPPVAYGLDEIREAAVSEERLLLLMRDGACVALAVDQPRLLRVQIAAARSAARSAARARRAGQVDGRPRRAAQARSR